MANTYGLSSLVFGTIPLTGYVVQASTLSKKMGVNAVVYNEIGQEVCRRYDDLIQEISIDAMFNGGSSLIPGATFTYNGTEYELVTVDTKWANREHEKVSIKGKTSANITLS